MVSEISLTLTESKEVEDGVVRLDPLDMRLLNLQPGDTVALVGQRTTYARARAAFMEDRNQRLASVGPLLRANLGLAAGEKVRIPEERTRPEIADTITLEVEDDLDSLHLRARLRELSVLWHGRCVSAQDLLVLPGLERHPLRVRVAETKPAHVVQIGSGTSFVVNALRAVSSLPPLGGLRDLYRTCSELARARLKENHPSAAHAVLLTGPTGCGKARLVSRLTEELGLFSVVLDAHQLIDRAVVSGTAELDVSLTALAKRGPTIIVLDHLDAIKDGGADGAPAIVAAQRSILAQLCALLDELRLHPGVMVFAVASDDIAPRFYDHGRFDLVLPVEAPNRFGRHEILALATQGVPLADGLDLARIAAMTPGTTARDLLQLVASASLLSVDVKAGEGDFVSAYRAINPSAASEVRCDIPTTSWEDVAGLDDIKQLMRETLSWSLRHHEKFAISGVRPPRSILLSGGQGTGKTSLVRALAGFTPLNFIEVACPLLAARSIPDAVSFIRESFALARRKAPCLVFFDDIDVLFEIAGPTVADAPHLHPIVAQLLAELDEINLIFGVVVVAATNRPDRLTTEVLRPGRFDFAVTLPMPDVGARKKVFEIHAHKLPLADDVDFDRLAAITQGMSPAEIANLCSRVGLMALRQSLNSGDGAALPPVVNADLFEQSLRGRKT
jgi:transitional endoplasmic reticulum ATPase